MDILFGCPKCGQRMVIDGAAAGLRIQCPKCGCTVGVPDAGGQGPTPSTKPANFTPPDREKTVALKWIPPRNTEVKPKQ